MHDAAMNATTLRSPYVVANPYVVCRDVVVVVCLTVPVTFVRPTELNFSPTFLHLERLGQFVLKF